MSKDNCSAKDAIKQYLDSRAASDPLFAKSYAKPKKNIDECFNYILNEAKKRGSSVCMTDDEVFSLAVHYYDEDNIKISSAPIKAHVEKSASKIAEVKLSGKEKAAAKEAAIQEYKRLCLAEEAKKDALRKKAASEKKKNDARKKTDSLPYSPSLFDFDEV